jgi:hypothetical protein
VISNLFTSIGNRTLVKLFLLDAPLSQIDGSGALVSASIVSLWRASGTNTEMPTWKN